ncbi:unnamed protein product [Moneuplotes crassus]|uniref:Uncharacterized protein n=1 Tax=Euplotes crassus TaxID=5936 RepID=A0AAD1X2L0_EUPCR|nr:unnamed protein product [Moneuplotes crassus]
MARDNDDIQIMNTLHHRKKNTTRCKTLCCCCFCKPCKGCRKSVKNCCAWLAKTFKSWQNKIHKYFPHRFFLSIYCMTIMETLFIISVTAGNELKVYDDTNDYLKRSIRISIALLSLLATFIVFLFIYFFMHCKTKISEKSKKPGMYFEILFSELKSGIGRIYSALMLFRKFAFVCVVFLPSLNSNWIFGILIVIQFFYWMQTIKFPKFESVSLRLMNIINESVIGLIIIILSIWNEKNNWDETNTPTMKTVIMYGIIGNTLMLIFIQSVFILYHIIKMYKDYFPSDQAVQTARDNREENKSSQDSSGS